MRILLIVTGLFNAAFAAFHVFLGIQIAHWPGFSPAAAGLMQTLNAAGGLTLVFLAFAQLARAKEVMGTFLGAGVLALGFLLYGGRVVAEFLWMNQNLMIAAVAAVMALLHAILFIGVRVTRKFA